MPTARCQLLVLAAALAAGEPEAWTPATYADAAGFAQRRQVIIDCLAQEDLAKWRTGYFAGGDPGKYLPGAAWAKLSKDPQDAMARQYLNDERSPREQYHFAAVNWARTLPLFGDALTAETKAALAKHASTFSAYLTPTGTENHKIMWWTSALVLPEYLEGGRIGKASKEDALRRMKEWIRSYVRGLYRAGQGEWDSCTYLMFDLHGMLNVHDFAKDEEARLWAGAALDWYVAAYALKYTDGIYCGPHQRGWCAAVAESIADQTGWLWWGSSATVDPAKAAFRYAMHAATSTWRPNRVLSALAQKRVTGLPAEWRNSKPNYWVGHGVEPRPGAWAESVLVAESFTLGCLWKGFGGQTTRLQVVARSPQGPVSVTGGTPIGRNDGDGSTQRGKYGDGGGMYDQTAAVGDAVVCLSRIPEDEADPHAFVTVPAGVTPTRAGVWWLIPAGAVTVAVHPLSQTSDLAVTPVSAKDQEKGRTGQPIIRMPGRQTGFVMQVITGDAAAATAALATCTLDASAFAAETRIAYRTRSGRQLTVAWQDGGRPAVTVDGERVGEEPWPVYGGPLLRCADGVLTVNDGREGYTVDVTGKRPVWKAWKP